MKKILSLFLALLLLLSVAGCSPEPVTTQPAATVPETVKMITVPQLVGTDIEELPESEEYSIQISHEMTAAGYFNGEIISQAPVSGAEAEFGAVIYVIVNRGGPEKEDMTEPPTTPPADTSTQYDDPDLPPQTDPPRPSVDHEQDYPKQTDPPETLPPQTDPPETLPPQTDPPQTDPPAGYLDPNGSYTSKNDVALYIHLYGRLPNNFITKNQAEDRYGWDGGSLSRYGMCIGGDRFYNNEGRLPSGYTYYECDIDTLYSSKRGAKRLVFTYSGIIYYTSDHYRTFQRLY